LSSWTVNNSNPNGVFDSGINNGGIYQPPGQLIDASIPQPGLTITVDPTLPQLFILLQPLTQ
jgi:hypothetical protein